METMYQVIWETSDGSAHSYFTEYGDEAADVACDLSQEGCDVETYKKESGYINYECIDF